MAELPDCHDADTDQIRHALGPWTIGLAGSPVTTVTLQQLKRLEIQFGIDAQTERSLSHIWPELVWVAQQTALIKIQGSKLEWFSTSGAIPLDGQAFDHTNTKGYLRKRDPQSSGFVADGTAEHIKFTGDGLAYIEDPHDAAMGNQAATISITLALRYDGTNAPLVIDTAAQIA